LASPPPEYSHVPFMTPRGALHIGTAEQQPLAAQMSADFAASGVIIDPMTPAQIGARLPFVRDDWNVGLYEPECCDIDVAALHGAYLRHAIKCGGQVMCNAPLRSANYRGGKWSIDIGRGAIAAKIIVNAAGAWADGVAGMAGIMPIGITPYRRTVAQLQMGAAIPPDLPLVIALDGSFYFKPGTGGNLWLSPHDETLTTPCDAAAEEIDIALAIDRFQKIAECGAISVNRKWAGLRSFAPDRLPVIGRDPACEAFFWLAGQGGFGIQTAPAVSALAASLLCDGISAPRDILAQNYAPERLR
jgi:D-arginine dehydrogenase